VKARTDKIYTVIPGERERAALKQRSACAYKSALARG
jgi:hypothetical protein